MIQEGISTSIPTSVDVVYFGKMHNQWQDEPVIAALSMDSTFNITRSESTTSLLNEPLNDQSILIIQDMILTPLEQSFITNWVQAGGVLLIFCGPQLTTDPSLFLTLNIINQSSVADIKAGYTNAVPKVVDKTESAIITGFDWNAMPDIRNYTIFPKTDQINNGILVEKQSREDSIRTDKDPLIFFSDLGLGRILVYSAWVEDGYSQAFRSSPFFNYLIYSSVITRAGLSDNKLSYSNWEYSPVPHTSNQWLFYMCILIAGSITFLLVRKAKHNSQKTLNLSKIKEDIEKEKQKKLLEENNQESPVPPIQERSSDSNKDKSVQNETKKKTSAIRHPGWEKIGLHKQIAGFFVSLITAILAAGPQIVLILFIFPRFIMPFPQAAGIYNITNDLFAALWLMLDVGTSIALVTFFSAHRVERPEKAVHYIQIFIFWQMISGICQFTAVSLFSLYYFPTIERYAYLSYHIFIHSAIQFPGFLSVMLLTLRALQRSDLEQISTLLVNFVFKLGVAYICVLIFRAVFKNSIQFGEIFGAIIGLNVGAWMGNFADFGFSYFLFKRAGYDGSMMFRWDFNKEEVFEVIKFGIRIVLGNVWVPAVATLQTILLTLHVMDYSSEMAYYSLALQIGGVIGLVGMLCDSLQAPISEAYTFKKEHGREQYLARVFTSGFKWVNTINFFLTSALLVIGWRIIIGFSGPTWSRASYYLILILIFQFLGPYSWIGDKFMLGCNMPNLAMIAWIVEQGTRALSLLIFIPLYGMSGVMLAYIPALLTKNLLLLVFIRKKITAPKVYWWQVWATPLIAAVLNYLILESLARLIWDGGIFTSISLFFIAVLGFLNVYSFFMGVLGGWDENELNEMKLAIECSPKALSILLRMIHGSVRLGMKTKSPFVGKSKIDLWDAAQLEMEELQALKKQLVI
jgi:O-antigen/teichoic acid export membrane protein